MLLVLLLLALCDTVTVADFKCDTATVAAVKCDTAAPSCTVSCDAGVDYPPAVAAAATTAVAAAALLLQLRSLRH